MGINFDRLKRYPRSKTRKTSYSLTADCDDWLRKTAKTYEVTISEILTAIIRDAMGWEEDGGE